MDDKQLERLQQELYNSSIVKNEEEERFISEAAQSIASSLLLSSNKSMLEFYDRKLVFKYRKTIQNFKEVIMLIAADENEINPLTNMPRHYVATSFIDNKLSFHENLRATVAALLRHLNGDVEISELEE